MSEQDTGSAFTQLITPDRPRRERPKPVYQMINPRIVQGKEILPHRDDLEGIEVLICTMLDRDGVPYPSETRTSMLLSVNTETGRYESMNSIYQLKVPA